MFGEVEVGKNPVCVNDTPPIGFCNEGGCVSIQVLDLIVNVYTLYIFLPRPLV